MSGASWNIYLSLLGTSVIVFLLFILLKWKIFIQKKSLYIKTKTSFLFLFPVALNINGNTVRMRVHILIYKLIYESAERIFLKSLTWNAFHKIRYFYKFIIIIP
ncbi:hypothetical protein CN533_22985 [Priestia megaterium]|nr:hypothetical protein CN533_22985 [Priestia megaterium]PFK82772.1 hypothetical protein COJ19_25330 [Priestia megaterium]